MESLQQPLFWFYLMALAVWLNRTRRALSTLNTAPFIRPNAAGREPGQQAPFASILVPAKNEETNIRQCIEGLLQQDYPNYEIIVVNDNSTDQTESILQSLGAVLIDGPHDTGSPRPSLRYLNSAPTPTGWTGKNHALHQAAPHARGEWYLFTDADTRHEAFSLSAALGHALAGKLSLLTLLPRCIAKGFFEKLIQPTAMGFMGLWFPIECTNNPDHPLHFANGQYLLIHKPLYHQIGGHKKVRNAFLEDFALMQQAKTLKALTQCAFGTAIYGTRMYESLSGILRGWKRIYLHASNRNPALLASWTASVLVFTLCPWFFLPLLAHQAHANSLNPLVLAPLACLALTVMSITAWKTYSIVHAFRLYSLLHPLAAVFIVAILIEATRSALLKHATVWR